MLAIPRLRYTIDQATGLDLSESGRYLLFGSGHFTSLQVLNDGSCLVSFGHRRHERTDVHPAELDLSRYEAVMRVIAGASTHSFGRDFLGGSESLQHHTECIVHLIHLFCICQPGILCNGRAGNVGGEPLSSITSIFGSM